MKMDGAGDIVLWIDSGPILKGMKLEKNIEYD